MLNKIKSKLESIGCDGWELTETVKNGWEFYFIRHELDQNRAVEIDTIEIKLYKSIGNGEFLGNASGEISPTASDEEIDERLSSLLYQASLVKNPAYKLNDKPIEIPDKTDEIDIEKIAEDFIKTIKSVEETENEYINSYEIFVNSLTRHYLNSNGVEYTCVYPESTVDIVVNARKGDHEIEMYRFLESGTCDGEKLKKDIADAMHFGSDRLDAVPTPMLNNYDVVFSTADAVQIYDYFVERMASDYIVRQISDWEIGKPVVADTAGDKISVKALPSLKNSSKDFPVDKEGAVISEQWLIEDGIAKNYFGSRQFSQYLGLENSSNVYNVCFSGGKKSAEEIRTGDYLEIVEFSDFQVDDMGGDIAGEIRVAYLHKDGKTTVVTGGSVSGNMIEAAKDMAFSSETSQYDTRVIPSVTKLKNLRITGAE